MFRKYRPVVLEKAWGVVVDILHGDGEGGCRRLRRVAVICSTEYEVITSLKKPFWCYSLRKHVA
jgi:hypothetical protein